MNNVKKNSIYILVILVVAAVSFFCGYTKGINNRDEARIRSGADLIEQQEARIETIDEQIDEAIEQGGLIVEEGRDIKTGLGELEETVNGVETGLQSDINGLQSVIDRLRYYEEQSDVLEKGDAN